MADQTIQRVFTGGEISPSLRVRADLSRYSSSLALCINFIVRSQGGAYSRPGTRFIDEIGDSAKVGRLIPFSFNVTQNYILVFEHLTMRVVKDGGYVMSGGLPYEIVTTYTEAELPRLIFTQDADVMTITHPSHDPATLSRTAHDNWTLANVSFSGTVAAPSATLAIAAVGTASGLANKQYRYVLTTVIDGKESVPSAELQHTINAMSVTYGSRLTWGAVTGADYYRVYRDPSNGTGVYAWVGDTENLVFEDYNISPDTSDSPPSEYLPFANANNKPSCVGYYQQRQIYANTTNEPQKAFCSQSGVYSSMRYSRPSRASDAIFFTIKAQQVNEIRHIVGMDNLILLTSGGEWVVTEGQEQVLAPSTVGVRKQSAWGSSWVPPAIVGDSILFVQEKGTKIRDLTNEVAEDKYRGNDLSIMAQHLFEDHEIIEMTYSSEPFGILWCVRDDGALLGLTYQKEHAIWAWHQHSTDGEFESCATISEDGRDATYFIVKRTIDGATVRYIERMEPRYVSSSEDVWCVDCGLQYDGAAATNITGLDHLEGEAVAVVADGNVVVDMVVSGGEIDLPTAASKVTVGLPYTPALETLDIEIGSLQETLLGKEVSISNVLIKIESSRGGWVGGINNDGTTTEMMEIKPRFDSDDYDALTLKTGSQEVTIQPNWGKGGRLRIEQRVPMPLAILAIIPDVDIS